MPEPNKIFVLLALTHGHVILESMIFRYIDQTHFDATIGKMQRQHPKAFVTFLTEQELEGMVRNIAKLREGYHLQ